MVELSWWSMPWRHTPGRHCWASQQLHRNWSGAVAGHGVDRSLAWRFAAGQNRQSAHPLGRPVCFPAFATTPRTRADHVAIHVRALRRCALFVFLAGPISCLAADLSKAVIVTPAQLMPRERKAVEMLVQEVEKRSKVRWPMTQEWPADGMPAVVVGTAGSLASQTAKFNVAARAKKEEPKDQAAKAAEGFRFRSQGGNVLVAGNDERGLLFGIGYLLRQLHMTPNKVAIDDGLDVTTAPKYPLRGHQLGYRPKTNSYDAWDLAKWEQYYRDLAVFGCNAIELIRRAATTTRRALIFRCRRWR